MKTFLRSRTMVRSLAWVVLVSSLGIGIRWFHMEHVPVRYPTMHIPDAAVKGDVEQALNQSRELLIALRKVNWDVNRVPDSLKFLPDASMAEDEMVRKRRAYSFTFPCASPEPNPLSEQVAFTSAVYSRLSPVVYRGDRVKTHPTGFYIVGWKHGEVTTVPVDDVRVLKLQDQHAWVPLYPGMKEYDPSAMKLPWIEFANSGANSEEARAFYASVMGKDEHAGYRQ